MKRHGHIASSYAMALMLIANGVFAQDVVFSEPITAPLTLNPAWAGAVNDMEANLVQRTQQNPLGDPFRTLAAGFASSLKSKSESNAAGRSGVGVQLVSDRTSAMNTTQIALSFAHHVAITRNSSVGVGLQGGLLQTAQNGADGQWGSQYDGLQYDSSIPSGEASIRNKHTALDLGGGVVYAVHWGVGRDAVQNRFTAGISGQHLARPQLFSDPAQDRIAVRWAAFTQARLLLGKPTNYLAPAAYFFAQGPSNIAIVGGAFGHVFGASKSFQNEAVQVKAELGASWRSDGAIVAKLALRWSAFSIALTYDFPTTSTMAFKSATEVALGYASEQDER